MQEMQTVLRKLMGGKMSKVSRTAETLCWKCANATNNGCLWSRSLIPVDGWIAEEDHHNGDYMGGSYLVRECPKFMPDGSVRCKECRFMKEVMKPYHFYWCRLNEMPTDLNFCCIGGERRKKNAV